MAGMTAAEWNRQTVMAWHEDVLQARVEELLRLHRWEYFHDQDSRRNRAGLPDLIAVRGPRLLFAELKSTTGRLRPAQRKWAGLLEVVAETTAIAATDVRGCRPVEVYLWRPIDYLSGRIAAVLT